MTADREWWPLGWSPCTIQGVDMVDCGEHGIRPRADAALLRDLLTTTSRKEPIRSRAAHRPRA